MSTMNTVTLEHGAEKSAEKVNEKVAFSEATDPACRPMDGKTEACAENGMAGNPDRFDVARKYSDEYYEEYIAAFRPNTKKRYVYRFCKRTLDIVLSLLAIIVFSPLFLAIAIAIKCDSKGPVLFKQKRVGRKGKVFYCLKFRSMKITAPGIRRLRFSIIPNGI